MKAGRNPLLWLALGVMLVAIAAFGAVSSRVASFSPESGKPQLPAAAQAPAATPTAADARPAAQSTASQAATPQASTTPKPFLAEYQDPQPQAAPNTVATIAGLIVKLGIVIALIYLTVLGLRFISTRGRNSLLGSSFVTVVERTALAQNRDLYLIDVANKVLLLGATANSLTVLAEITDEQALEELRSRPLPALPSAEPFLAYLRNVGEKVGAEVANVTPLRPADVLKRIETHRDRIRASTASLREVGS